MQFTENHGIINENLFHIGGTDVFSSRIWSLLADSFWKILLPGLTATIPLTVISFSLAMVIAVCVAMVQFANVKVLKQLCRFYIWIFRGTPLLVQLFFLYFGLPKIGILISSERCAVIGLSFLGGSYMAEAFRSGLEAVEKVQTDEALLINFRREPEALQMRLVSGQHWNIYLPLVCRA